MVRRKFLQSSALTLMMGSGLVAQTSTVHANDSYPAGSVEVIHEFGPGGGTDSFVRAISVPFEKAAGDTLVPISITGGAGLPAAATFMQRPPNGQTMLAIGPENVINHVLGRIDLGDYQPIARVQFDQGLFYVRADSEFQTIQDLVEHAKANPGQLKIATVGAAGFDATLVGLWNSKSGAQLSPIPFKGSSEALASALGGHTDVLYEEYGPSRGVIDSGELRPLVVFSEERLPVLPDVPTATELGYDVTLGRWRGFALKADDSKDHADRLVSILKESAAAPEYKKVEESNALQYRSKFLGPDEFSAFIESEISTYTDVLGEISATQ